MLESVRRFLAYFFPRLNNQVCDSRAHKEKGGIDAWIR